MGKTVLSDLKRLGLRPGAVFEELVSDPKVRRAFEECTGLKLAYEFPLLTDGADPCFAAFAHVGDGTEYGFYVYPPTSELSEIDPIVQWDHDGPSIEFEACDFPTWLIQRLDDVPEGKSGALLRRLIDRHQHPRFDRNFEAKLLAVLPTAESQAEARSIRKFLEQPPPKETTDLISYERNWNRCRLQSVFADDAGQGEVVLLLAYGIETYERLNWRFPYEALVMEDSELDLHSARERPKNEASVWAKLHSPTTASLAKVVTDAVSGATFAQYVITHWIHDFSFDRSLSGGPNAQSRQVLGDQLSSALSGATDKAERKMIGEWLKEHEWVPAAALVAKMGLPDIAEALKKVEHLQQLGRTHATEGNDWSEL